MNKKVVEETGIHLKEAVSRALEQLKTRLEDTQITILETPISSKRWFQKKQFKIRAVNLHEKINIYTGRLGQFGDIIMFIPVIRRLKDLYPNSSITFAIGYPYQEIAGLISRDPGVDRVFIPEYYFDKPGISKRLRKKWFYQEAQVDWRGPKEIEEQNQHDLVLQTRPPSSRYWYLEGLHHVWQEGKSVGIYDVFNWQAELYPDPSEKLPLEIQKEYAVIHTYPSWERKRWAFENFTGIVKRLKNLGLTVCQVGGKEEPAVPGAVSLCGELSFNQTALLIQSAKLFIGGDSCPIHIAGAFHTPSVGIYSGGNIVYPQALTSSFEYPVNPNATYLEASFNQHCNAISVEDVWKAVCRSLNIVPQFMVR